MAWQLSGAALSPLLVAPHAQPTLPPSMVHRLLDRRFEGHLAEACAPFNCNLGLLVSLFEGHITCKCPIAKALGALGWRPTATWACW